MSDLQTALRARLLADSAISGLVGTRIYWATRPQSSVLPAIVLRMVSQNTDDLLDGQSGMVSSAVQCECMDPDYGKTQAIAKAVKSAVRDEAEQGGILFWNATISGPTDQGEDLGTSFVNMAVLELFLRHTL